MCIMVTFVDTASVGRLVQPNTSHTGFYSDLRELCIHDTQINTRRYGEISLEKFKQRITTEVLRAKKLFQLSFNFSSIY